MSKKNFIQISLAGAIMLLAIWGIILAFMGETSKVPLAIGSFVVGWYMQKIYDRVKEVRRYDTEGRIDSERSGEPLRC